MVEIKNSILRNPANVVRKSLLIGFIFLSLVSCKSYVGIDNSPQTVLAVTSAGDTVQVPISQFRSNYYDNYYNNWQFYYGNNWWYWNDIYLRYPRYSYFYNRVYVPYYRVYTRPLVPIRPRIQVNSSNVRVNRNRYEVNANPIRSQRQTQSHNNGWRGRSRENVSPKPAVPRQPRTVQPRQIRRGSGSSVLQQYRSSQQSSGERRSSSSRREN